MNEILCVCVGTNAGVSKPTNSKKDWQKNVINNCLLWCFRRVDEQIKCLFFWLYIYCVLCVQALALALYCFRQNEQESVVRFDANVCWFRAKVSFPFCPYIYSDWHPLARYSLAGALSLISFHLSSSFRFTFKISINASSATNYFNFRRRPNVN